MLEEILRNVEQCLGKELADTQKLLAEYLIKHGYDSKHVANELRNMEYSYNWGIQSWKQEKKLWKEIFRKNL